MSRSPTKPSIRPAPSRPACSARLATHVPMLERPSRARTIFGQCFPISDSPPRRGVAGEWTHYDTSAGLERRPASGLRVNETTGSTALANDAKRSRHTQLSLVGRGRGCP